MIWFAIFLFHSSLSWHGPELLQVAPEQFSWTFSSVTGAVGCPDVPVYPGQCQFWALCSGSQWISPARFSLNFAISISVPIFIASCNLNQVLYASLCICTAHYFYVNCYDSCPWFLKRWLLTITSWKRSTSLILKRNFFVCFSGHASSTGVLLTLLLFHSACPFSRVTTANYCFPYLQLWL